MKQPKKRSSPIPDKPLAEVELAMMNIIWRIGPCTIRQMLALMAEAGPGAGARVGAAAHQPAYTTVSTIVRILEQKGFVKSQKEGKTHLYFAAFAKEIYESKSIGHMVERVFDGAPSALVRRLIGDQNLSREEISELQELLQEKIKEADGRKS